MTPAVIPVPTLRSGHTVYLSLTNGVRVTVKLDSVSENGLVARRIKTNEKPNPMLSFFPFFNIVEMEF